jgi:hypothetical protein
MSGFAAVQATAESDVPVLQTFHALGAVKQRWQRAADTSPRERIGIESELARTVDRIVATCSDEVTDLSAMGRGKTGSTWCPAVSTPICSAATDPLAGTRRARHACWHSAGWFREKASTTRSGR